MQSKIGNKGNNLVILKNKGFNVPNFTALGYDFFTKFLLDIGALTQAQNIKGKNGQTEQLFKSIKHKILNEKISNDIENLILETIKDLTFPISVRSSASIEDSDKNSGAGIFYTGLNVSKENVVYEVRKVLASLYDNKNIFLYPEQNFNPQNYFMGIVFQEMISSEYSGVAFSCEPITGDNSEIYIELGEGLGENIVNGMVNTVAISIQKYRQENSYNEKYPFINDIKNEILLIENHYNISVDIEWAYFNNALYILQCRPITTIKPKPIIENIKIFSMSGLNDETYPYLSYLQKRYPSWTKKANFFKFCEENNIKTNKWRFMIFNKELFNQIPYDKLFENYDTDLLICHLTSSYHTHFFTNELKFKLEDMISNVNDNSYCISVRESIPNESCVISTVNTDCSVSVEFFFGKMRYYNSGNIIPSKYKLDFNGNILEEELVEQYLWCFEKEKKDIVQTETKSLGVLDKELLKEICDKTLVSHNHFGDCTVEWWLWDNKLYACDISLLNNSSEFKNKKCISMGNITGHLYKLPELDKDLIYDINNLNTFSVKDFSIDEEEHYIYKYLDDVFSKWSKDEKIILYSDKPYLFLAPFIKYIDGFIFKNASSLCHLSLILRENNVPALSLNDDELIFEDGQLIELNANKGKVKLK